MVWDELTILWGHCKVGFAAVWIHENYNKNLVWLRPATFVTQLWLVDSFRWNKPFLARWLTSARAYRIGGRKLCPSVCLYVKRYLLLQFCTDYNQTWINMIWAVAAKTLLSQIFHNWRRIEVNCVYISHCKWYRTSAGMPACIPNRRCCAGQCAGQ